MKGTFLNVKADLHLKTLALTIKDTGKATIIRKSTIDRDTGLKTRPSGAKSFKNREKFWRGSGSL